MCTANDSLNNTPLDNGVIMPRPPFALIDLCTAPRGAFLVLKMNIALVVCYWIITNIGQQCQAKSPFLGSIFHFRECQRSLRMLNWTMDLKVIELVLNLHLAIHFNASVTFVFLLVLENLIKYHFAGHCFHSNRSVELCEIHAMPRIDNNNPGPG